MTTPPSMAIGFHCAAMVTTGKLVCGSPPPIETPPGLQPVVLGNQGELVELNNQPPSYDETAEVFSAQVRLQNLLGQPLGTNDGSTATGIRVFFEDGPTVQGGSGTVTVKNPDDYGTFTKTNQPYFQYDEILGPAEQSAYKLWEWNVPATVDSFDFYVFVDADVQYPNFIGARWVATPASVNVGGVSVISLELDVTQISEPLNSLVGSVSWNPTVLDYRGDASGSIWTVFFANETPAGTMRFSAASGMGVSGDVLTALTFSVEGLATGCTELTPILTELTSLDPVTFDAINLLQKAILMTQTVEVCVTGP